MAAGLARVPVIGDLLDRLAQRRAVGGLRCDPGRRGMLAMATVAVLTVAVVGCWVLAARPHRLAAAAPPAPAAFSSISPGGSLASPLAPSPTPAASSAAAGQLVVDVVGKVRRPGVYRLTAGARVNDAVTAAGGTLPGVDPVTVNLARKLTDGEQVVVGVAAAPAQPVDGGAADSAADAPSGGVAGALVDLNSATESQLDALPGVGPVLAQHILDYRTQHGRFGSVDELNSVSGIGDAKFADLKDLVTVG